MSGIFERYAIIDWSAANAPTTGKDSIWIAVAERSGREVTLVETLNPPTRSAAMEELRRLIRESIAAARKLFVGFDFPFGYPAGAAEAIAGSANWKDLWKALAELVRDRDDNVSNRFEVGGRLNRGPLEFSPMFWGRPAFQDIPGLSPTKPNPYPSGLPERRMAEARTRRAQPVWKLAFTGSVGSQAITGMARLHELLGEEEFAGQIAVWPFETLFAKRLSTPVVIGEIYPGLFPIEQGDKSCLDEAQVETVARSFARFDADGRFAELLAAPADLSEEEKRIVLSEEGWILGLGHALTAEESKAAAAEPSLNYLRDPAAIYETSFRTIRAEADLWRLPVEARDLAIRLIHACGMIDIVKDLVVSEGAVAAGAEALTRGAPIVCDCEMVAHGIIRRKLPAGNPIVCRLNDHKVEPLARRLGTTRSAAQVDLWDDCLENAIVAIGNAPTALFHLLERLDSGAPKPALVLGFPVGFVGAAESKAELALDLRGVPFITLRGRRGGSAMAAAAVNALAAGLEAALPEPEEETAEAAADPQ